MKAKRMFQAQAIEAPIPGYGIVDFTWEVETFPGGPKENITGTIQDVVTVLTSINPDWKSDFNFSDSLTKRLNNEKRLSFPFTGIICNHDSPFSLTLVNDVRNAISYLYGVPGSPTEGPGPGNCARVSCLTRGSAIWWCNDVSLQSYTRSYGSRLIN